MKTIVLDIFPAIGHYNASFLLAKYLLKENRVIYLCNNYSQKIVSEMGFETYLINSNTFLWLDAKKYLSGMCLSYLPLSRKQNKQFLIEMMNEYRQMKKILKPDFVMLDSHHFYKVIIYHHISCRVMRFQSMMSTYKHSYIAPLCFCILPTYTWKGKFESEFLWGILLFRHISYIGFQFLYHFFNSYFANIMSLSKLCNYPLLEHLEFYRYTKNRIELKGYPELVIPPVAFDFPSEDRNVLTYPFGLDGKKDPTIFPSRYITILKKLQILRTKKMVFVVYCSLGTLGMVDKGKAICFFEKLKKVATMDNNLFFIFSVGKGLDHERLLPIPKNIRIFRQVPQCHLLQFCDMMITHGGMNSITECIFRQIPMLVYPLNRNWDQPGNAARIVFHGLGMSGNISRDSSRQIYKKINQIRENYSRYKMYLDKMEKKIEETPDTLTPYLKQS